MRMWMTNPSKMCRKHLLGEHVECHMFVGTIKKGISIKGYLEKGLLETHNLQKRHDELAKEMTERGYKHNSVLECCFPEMGNIDVKYNEEDLKRRCLDCRGRITNGN